MSAILALLFIQLLSQSKAQETTTQSSRKLSELLVGDDGRVYACSENYLYSFESNGSVAWSIHLNFSCNVRMAPVHGGRGKLYLVAENRVLIANFSSSGALEARTEVFFGQDFGTEGEEIIGLSVSTSSSAVFINVKNRGLFAFLTNGQLLWSAGPVIYEFGYRQGCRRNTSDCFFTSVPVIDQCEASIYISNSEGELYSVSIRSPYFRWIQDLSSFDKSFVVTAGNNGRVYVTVPAKALLLALDVSSGKVLWQGSIGPLSTSNSAPVVDSNGWTSIGSLDGFLYSFSPTGTCKKFSKAVAMNSVIQASPFLDCSGYALYYSQTEMEQKISHTIDGYTYVSAKRPLSATFTLLVPSTGSIYWSEGYPGKFASLISGSDLHRFLLDERTVLAFLAASRTGNPLPCRSKRQKLLSSCSQARPKQLSNYPSNERAILLFLLFESVVLIVLAALVRFCCIFWKKRKLQGQKLGSFLDKRRELQLRKKSFDRTITKLKQKAAAEAGASEVFEQLGNLVNRREGIERKLSTTYSLGRDRAKSQSTSKSTPLPLRETTSFSYRSGRKESVTIFHTFSDTSSRENSSNRDTSWDSHEDTDLEAKIKVKGKAPAEVDSSSDNGNFAVVYARSPTEPKPFTSSLLGEKERKVMDLNDEEEVESENISGRRVLMKRRKALSSTN